MDAKLEAALARASTVVFLCSGNMIRSAFAELYARHRGCAVPLRSAGTVYHNDAIYPATARELELRGVPTGAIRAFRPTHVDELLPELDDDTLYLGMKLEHLSALPHGVLGRAFLLSRALGTSEEIADPMFEGGLEEVLGYVARCVDALVVARAAS